MMEEKIKTKFYKKTCNLCGKTFISVSKKVVENGYLIHLAIEHKNDRRNRKHQRN